MAWSYMLPSGVCQSKSRCSPVLACSFARMLRPFRSTASRRSKSRSDLVGNLAISIPPNAGQRGGQALGEAGAPVVLVAPDVKLMVLAEELERVDLAGEPEPDAADLAGLLAPAVWPLR